ncbi:DUF4145 domain-containing protein [Clostridium cadaveris]|nr:DUF4145 domain-containing protein [Clostridium cadaveris]MDU4953449.1 DUF4145 domain-containing protein [Clostridium sp.]NME64427.1 DUF4145 domain-containing protein [Clostridium cadaveris]
MNKTQFSTLYTPNGSKIFDAEKPIICPHCGAFISPPVITYNSINVSNSVIFLIAFKSTCCDKVFFATYKIIDSKSELLTIYPPNKPEILPDAIQAISPRFVNLYNQAYIAEQNNHFELAGSGYRNALEVLIKDYAINELNKDSNEVIKKTLNGAIKEYVPSIRLSNSADVIRLLGNDYTHYERHYEDIDFQVLKRYLHIFLNNIENEYLINHPIVAANNQKK